MDKESIIESQCIDCNCNDCAFLARDIAAYNKNIEQDKKTQLWFFRRKKAIRIWRARKNKDKKKREQALKEAFKLSFSYFPQKVGLNYGECLSTDRKYNTGTTRITFLPNTLQLHTQQCFVHRKKINNENN